MVWWRAADWMEISNNCKRRTFQKPFKGGTLLAGVITGLSSASLRAQSRHAYLGNGSSHRGWTRLHQGSSSIVPCLMYALSQGLSLNPDLTRSASLDSQLALGGGISPLSPGCVTDELPHPPGFSTVAGDMNSSSYVCVASSLPSP